MNKPPPPDSDRPNGRGYFPVCRAIMNGGFSKKSWALLDMQNLASFKTREIFNAHGDKMWIYRGEMLANMTGLAKRWKVSRMNVYRWFKQWESEGLITIRRFSDNHHANTITKMTYYETGGLPLQTEKDDVTPPAPLKVASINELQEQKKKSVTPIGGNVTGVGRESVTGVDDHKSMEDNGLYGEPPF